MTVGGLNGAVVLIALIAIIVVSKIRIRRYRSRALVFLDQERVAPPDFGALSEREVLTRFELYSTLRENYLAKPEKLSEDDRVRLGTLQAAIRRLDARREQLKTEAQS